MQKNKILTLHNLTKTYTSGSSELTVLHEVTLSIHEGETCAVVGPSGSGKTTLLGLCAGLDRPSQGHVELSGVNLNTLSEDESALLRNQHVGFVFQSFQLIPTLTAIENIMVPAELRGERGVAERARFLLASVGLEDRATHYPNQLSGGEQQRVGIARAFINKPRILFADEPTGNLDAETGETIESLLFDLNEKEGTTLVLVTHDLELAQKTSRIIRLKGGRVVADEPRPVTPAADPVVPVSESRG